MTRAMLVFLLLTGTAFAAEPNWILSTEGLGPIDVGIRADKLKILLETPLPYNPAVHKGCGTFTTPKMAPRGISFLMETSILTRINVDFYDTDPRPLEIKTTTGIGLRSPEEDLLKAYAGQTRIVPNPGDPTWHTIYVDSSDRRRALVFETDGKTVKSMRVGEYPIITSPAGCD